MERALPALGYTNVSAGARSARRSGSWSTPTPTPRPRDPGRRDVPAAARQPGDRGVHDRGRASWRHDERPRIGVVLFPGTNCELDVRARGRAARRDGRAALARRRRPSRGVDAVVVPGGFAHGDYLRTGAIARFSPVMDAVAELRRRRRSGRRHLQRLPGAHRGRPAARRAAEERGPQVPCASTVDLPGRDHRYGAHQPADGRRACCASRSTTSRATTSATPTTLAALRADDRVVVRYVRQPERQPRRHRRHLQRGRQRGGAHAAPRAGVATRCSARPTAS